MPSFRSIYGPFYPFGLITVSTPGTPVSLTVNLSAAEAKFTATGGGAALGGSEYSGSFAEFIISIPTGNTGNIYLVVPGGSKTQTNSIILILPSTITTPFTIYTSQTNRNAFGMNDFQIDADTANNGVYITGVVA